MPKIYARLDIGNSKTRLTFLRNRAANRPGATWRDVREKNFSSDQRDLSPGFNSKDYGVRSERYPVMMSYGAPMFRAEQWADECDGVRIDHRGWFSDADCSRTLRAFVFRLSHGRWGCGYADSDSGERVYLLEVHPDAASAAASADHEAQHYAEEEKEYNERWQEARELRDDIANKGKSIKRLYALRNAGVDSEVRAELLEEIDELRKMRAALARDYADIDE